MSVPVVDAWLDEDGLHVWTKHPCVDGIVTAMLPHPHWSVEAHGNVRPSVHCLACGAHQFVNVTQGRWCLLHRLADRGEVSDKSWRSVSRVCQLAALVVTVFASDQPVTIVLVVLLVVAIEAASPVR